MTSQHQITLQNFKIGNDLPFVHFGRPLLIESRDRIRYRCLTSAGFHRAPAFRSVYKSSYDKANRTSLKGVRGIGMEKGLEEFSPTLKRIQLPRCNRHPHRRAMRHCREVCRHPADPRLPLPSDRPADCSCQNRQDHQREKRPVPCTVGHEERRCENHRKRQPQRYAVRARYIVWL